MNIKKKLLIYDPRKKIENIATTLNRLSCNIRRKKLLFLKNNKIKLYVIPS